MPDTTKLKTTSETTRDEEVVKRRGAPDALADPLSDPLTLQLGTSSGGEVAVGDDSSGGSAGFGGGSIGPLIKGAQAGRTEDGAEMKLGEVRKKGWSLDDAYAEVHSGSSSVSAKVGHAGKGPHARDVHAKVGSDGVDVGVGEAGWGGGTISGASLTGKTAGSETEASLGSLSKGVSVKDAHLKASGEGISASVGEVSEGMSITGASLSHTSGDSEYAVKADSISTRQTISGAGVSADEDGVRGKVDEISTGSLALGGLSGAIKEGDTELSGSLGSFTSADTFLAKDASVELDGDGVRGEVGKVQYGGWDINDAALKHTSEGSSTEMKIGALGNSNTIEDASFSMGGDGIKGSLGSIDHGSTTLSDASLTHESDGLSLSAKAGEIKKVGTIVKGASAEVAGDGSSGKLGAEEVTVGGMSVQDASAAIDFKKLDASASASVGSFGSSSSAKEVEASWDESGARVKAKEISAMGMDVENAKAGVEVGGSSISASVGELHTGLLAKDIEASLTEDGLQAKTGEIKYRTAEAKDISIASKDGLGLVSSSVKAEEASFQKISAESTSASITKDGIAVGATGIDASLASGKGVELETEMLGMEGSVGAGEVEVLGGSADELTTTLSTAGLELNGKNIEAHALEAKDVTAALKSGDTSLGVSAKELIAGKVSADEVKASSDLTGLVQSASIKGFKVTVLDTDDAKVGLTIADEEVLAIKTDASLTGGVEEASASIDVFQGKASMSVKEATAGVQLDDTSINVMGSEIELPSMGAEAVVSSSTDIDVTDGKFKTHTSLAGSSANFAGMEIELGEWAQAGADIDLSEGEFNLNVGGMEIDIDEGFRQASDFISSFF